MAARVFSRFMKFLIVLVLLAGAAVSATWVRYHSFDPCVWTEQDMLADSSLPALIVKARIKAAFPAGWRDRANPQAMSLCLVAASFRRCQGRR